MEIAFSVLEALILFMIYTLALAKSYLTLDAVITMTLIFAMLVSWVTISSLEPAVELHPALYLNSLEVIISVINVLLAYQTALTATQAVSAKTVHLVIPSILPTVLQTIQLSFAWPHVQMVIS